MNANDLGNKKLFDIYNAVDRVKDNNTIDPYSSYGDNNLMHRSPGLMK